MHELTYNINYIWQVTFNVGQIDQFPHESLISLFIRMNLIKMYGKTMIYLNGSIYKFANGVTICSQAI